MKLGGSPQLSEPWLVLCKMGIIIIPYKVEVKTTFYMYMWFYTCGLTYKKILNYYRKLVSHFVFPYLAHSGLRVKGKGACNFFCFVVFKDFKNSFERQSTREKKGKRKTDLPSTSSLPKCSQWLVQGQPYAMCQNSICVSHVGSRDQIFVPSSVTFPLVLAGSWIWSKVHMGS